MKPLRCPDGRLYARSSNYESEPSQDDDCENDEGVTNQFLADVSIEDLVQIAEKEQVSSEAAERQLLRQRKQGSQQRRKDREYEQYWEKQNKRQEQMLQQKVGGRKLGSTRFQGKLQDAVWQIYYGRDFGRDDATDPVDIAGTSPGAKSRTSSSVSKSGGRRLFPSKDQNSQQQEQLQEDQVGSKSVNIDYGEVAAQLSQQLQKFLDPTLFRLYGDTDTDSE